MSTSPNISMKKKKFEEEVKVESEKIILKKSSPIKEPKLTKQFVQRVMMKQLNCKKHLTQQNILQLLHDYKKIIEHYNSKQDFIALYFQQKLQNLLSEQKSLQVFYKSNEEPVTVSMLEQNMLNPTQIQQFKELNNTPSKYDIESKKKQRSKKVQIYMEIKKTKKRDNAKTILNQYYEQCLQNNALVNNQINIQRKDLEQRLKAIQKRSQNNAEVLSEGTGIVSNHRESQQNISLV